MGPDPLAGFGPEHRVVLLGARTSLDDPARDALARLVAGRSLDWARVDRLADVHEVVPLVARSVREAASGPLADGGAAWLALAERRRHLTLLRNARMARTLASVLDGLAADGITALPVKGLFVAEHLYGDVALRPAADLDVLVPVESLDAARVVLRRLGFRQRTEFSFHALAHEFHDPAWFVGAEHEQVRLELHWALWSDRFFRWDPEAILGRARRVPFLGSPRLALAASDLITHLAIHRTRSALRLRWVSDVAAFVRHEPDLDWTEIRQRLADARARTAAWAVLDLAAGLLGAPVPDDVLRDLAPSALRRAALDRTCGRRALAGDATVRNPNAHLTLRVLELDGAARTAAALASSLARSARRALHERGVRREPRRVPGA